MKKDEILRMSLADIGFSSTLNMIRAVYWTISMAQPYSDQIKGAKIKSLASRLTVADIIESWNVAQSSYYLPDKWFIEVRSKVVSLGLTRIDWLALPASTVTAEKLRQVRREELLKKSCLVLGTITPTTYQSLAPIILQLKHPDRLRYQDNYILKISHILSSTEDKWGGNFDKCAERTRRLLIDAGFTYEDGAFLQKGTRRLRVEQLMRAESVNREEAGRIVDIACRIGWIRKTPQWDLFR